MANTLPKRTGARDYALPNSTRSPRFVAASILVALVAAVSWFEAPPVPALVGALGAGGVLLWMMRKR